MDVSSQKCLGCGATLKYNPQTQNFKCEYCNSEFTINDIESHAKDSELKMQINKESMNVEEGISSDKEYDVYTCPNCGAELITNDNTVATSCVYCKSSAVVKNRTRGALLPHKIIPFAKTKEDAINAFKSCTKGKLFAPKEFSDIKNLKETQGVYVPFWLYDSSCDVSFKAKGTKVTSWASGDYRYTKTDTYNVERDGELEFEKVPVDGSSKFEDDLMDSIEPFDYSKLVDFNEAYLSGFLAEKFDVSKEDASERMEKRVSVTSVSTMANSAQGYSSLVPYKQDVTINKGNISYVMLPVYMLNIKYDNKIYHFAMNGLTGKFVGQIPKDKKKAFLFNALAFIISALIVACLTVLF